MFRPRLTAFAGALLVASLAAPVGAAPVHAAPAKPAPSAPAAPGTYVVKDGDYLFGISVKLKVKLADLLAVNGLTVTSVIHPGDTLKVPASPPAASSGAVAAATQPAPPAPTKAQTVVAFATAQVGKPYKFAAAGPDAYDCSGLVTAAFKQVGVKLPQYSALQATYGTPVDITTQPIQAGDLVFLADGATGVIGHVGIAVSSTQWVQAVRAGDVVRVGKLPSTSKIAAVRRIVTG